LCLASLDFFKETGNRENRSKARLRHVREKLGDKWFKEELAMRFDTLLSSRDWPEVSLSENPNNFKLLRRLQLPNGNIGLDEAIQLADAAEPQGAKLRINLEHGLEIFGTQTFRLPDNLSALENLPVIIACPGLSSCAKALTNTWAVADAIRQQTAGINNPNLRICISGCPNSCAHSATADIGLIGLRQNRDGQSVECFRFMTGGHNGTDNRQAVAGEVVPAGDVPAFVERLLLPANKQTPAN
jgi:sulfite reductase beta subunit-like hemoprotein